MDSIFAFFFKYRPIIFQRGDFVFGAPWPVFVLAVVGLAVIVPTVLMYGRARGKARGRDRAVLTAIRVAVLAIILFALFQPTLVLSTVVPQKNFLGILIDDSRSMRIADDDDQPRTAYVQEQFGTPESPLYQALADRFILRFFRFSSDASRVDGATGLTYDGTATDLGRALDRARQELASVPLAGLVVVSDGADNTAQTLDQPLLELRARSLPVYAIGLGQERFRRDIEVSRVETPRTVLKGASVVVDVTITQTGFDGAAVDLVIEDGSRIVNTERVDLPREGEVATVRIPFQATEAGPRVFSFRIAPQPGEIVTENNEQEALIVVEDHTVKILYFEGEPRHEIGFTRRAVQGDENINLVTLVRTADNKFYRIDIEDAERDLVAGFPTTREELFAFSGLVLGSIEASYFTLDQLRMIADFVSERGGGLLALGGRRALAEGGFAQTPVADVLPVELDASAPDPEYLVDFRVAVTPAGRTHPITQIEPTIEASAERFPTLPALTAVNRVSDVKPGATTLLRAEDGDHVVLAFQRYGRGRAVALPVQDLWQWQMDYEIPLEDMTHETFLRQLLRWLVSGVPDRIRVTPASDRIAPGETVELIAEVEDDRYFAVNNTDVIAHVRAPSGAVDTVRLDWTVDRDGEYRRTITAREEGLYEVAVQAREDDEFLDSDAAYIRVHDPAREFFGAEMQAATLQRLADETEGVFYTPESASTLPEDISLTESGTTVLEQRDLWDMPIIFLAIMVLISAEWSYRRMRGLA